MQRSEMKRVLITALGWGHGLHQHCNGGVTCGCTAAPLARSAASLRAVQQSARSAAPSGRAAADGGCSPRTVQAAQPAPLLPAPQGCAPTRQHFCKDHPAGRSRPGAAGGMAADQLIHADRPVHRCSCSTPSGRPAAGPPL
jgi:hypothetical protein